MAKIKCLAGLFTLAILYTQIATAQSSYVVPSDENYYVYEQGHYRYVFSSAQKSLLPGLVQKNEYLKKLYQKEWLWELDETTSLVLTSPRNQISNAAATVIPNNLTMFYNSGVENEYFAARSWYDTLLSHETSHLYQLNVKRRISSVAKSVFGNTPFIGVWFAPLAIVHPNILLPTYVLEGNATMNENRFGNGGRLYNGRHRALVFSLMQAQKVTFNRLVNNHLSYPYGEEKYLVGGYLQAYLVEKYGIEKTNSFFWQHSTHFINPFLLNNTYSNTFEEKGYRQIMREFLEFYKPQYEKLKRSSTPVLQVSDAFTPLHRDSDGKIYFLTSRERKAYPELNTFDIATKTLSAETRNLMIGEDVFFGKVFKLDDGQFYVRTNGSVDITNIRYTLWGENRQPRADYFNRFVHDRRAGHEVWADSENSNERVQLFKDGQKFREVDSTALLDDSGRVYYFVQNGYDRFLYRDDLLLAKFKGYYGVLVDVAKDGTVFFVASTDNGSGLFSVKDREGIRRWSDSDVIVDAKMIGDKEFLVQEVTADHYEIRTIATDSRPETPAFYKYAFDDGKAPPLADVSKTPPAAISDNDIREYHSLRELNYGYTQPLFGYLGALGGYFAFNSVFTDPLYYNLLNIRAGWFGAENYEAAIRYTYARHRLSWYIGASVVGTSNILYNQDYTDYRTLGRAVDKVATLGLRYPLFISGHWTGVWTGELFHLHDENTATTTVDEHAGLANRLGFQRVVFFPRSYTYYRLFAVSLLHTYQVRPSGGSHKGGVTLNWAHDFGWENIVSLGASTSLANNNAVAIYSGLQYHHDPVDVRALTLGSENQFSQVNTTGLGYEKVLSYGLYCPFFPLSIRRFIPYASLRYVDTRTEKTTTTLDNYREWGYGVRIEFLVGHLLPFEITLGRVENDLPKKFTANSILVNMKQDF